MFENRVQFSQQDNRPTYPQQTGERNQYQQQSVERAQFPSQTNDGGQYRIQQQQQQQQFVQPPQYQGQLDHYGQQIVQSSPQRSTSIQQGPILQPQTQSLFAQSNQPAIYEHKIITHNQEGFQGNQIFQSTEQKIIKQYPQAQQISGKWSYCIDWCIYIALILFFIAILTFMAIIISQSTREFNNKPLDNVLKTLSQNQALNPIADIVPAYVATNSHSLQSHFNHKQTRQTCPEGFNLEPFGLWPGINSGCECDGQIKDSSFCWARGCNSIKEQSAKNLYQWDGGKVCVRRTRDWNTPQGQTCRDTYKLCGNICVKNSEYEECPLSNLIPKTLELISSYQEVQIGSKYYYKVYGGIPIVQFQVIPGIEGAQCFNQDTSTSFESKLYYPLSKQPASGCDKFGDLSEEKIVLSQLLTKTVYEQNDVDLASIPNFSSFTNVQDHFTLEAVQRIQVKTTEECQGLDSQSVDKIVENGEDIYNYRVWFSIIIFWLCVIALVIAFIFYLIRNRQFESTNIPPIKQPKMLLVLAVIVAVLCIIFGALYLWNVKGNNGIEQLNNNFAKYIENNCFEDRAIQNSIIQVQRFADQQYASINKWVLWAFWISIAFLVLLIILIAYQWTTFNHALVNPWQTYQQFH